jgi:hypothetical protein
LAETIVTPVAEEIPEVVDQEVAEVPEPVAVEVDPDRPLRRKKT